MNVGLAIDSKLTCRTVMQSNVIASEARSILVMLLFLYITARARLDILSSTTCRASARTGRLIYELARRSALVVFYIIYRNREGSCDKCLEEEAIIDLCERRARKDESIKGEAVEGEPNKLILETY